jgi:hypothetical protein
MSDEWPPGWGDEEDPEEEFPSEADEARLAEVTAYLASVPALTLPDAVAARISAALADEAAARAGTSSSSGAAAGGAAGAANATDGARTLGRTRSRVGPRRRGGGAGHRAFSKGTLAAAAAVTACLALAGLGYGLSRGVSSSSSSAVLGIAAGSSSAEQGGSQRYAGAAQAPSPARQSSAAAAASVPVPRAAGTASSASAPAASAQAPTASAPVTSAQTASVSPAASPAASPASGGNISFLVIASGTDYQTATLAAQVRARLSAPPLPGTPPSASLRACVSDLTGGRSPRLVDRATYQSSPTYIIASSSDVWVVGIGCTAANTELIRTVPLAG